MPNWFGPKRATSKGSRPPTRNHSRNQREAATYTTRATMANDKTRWQELHDDAAVDQYIPYVAPQGMPPSTYGTGPSGTMQIRINKGRKCPGYEDGEGSIVITYEIPADQQKNYHPNPSIHYNGTSRGAFLPNTPYGRCTLTRFRYAFSHGHMFRIGRSMTSNLDNQVVWNTNIPNKTGLHGGPFGFPDANYLAVVNRSMDALGIPSADQCLTPPSPMTPAVTASITPTGSPTSSTPAATPPPSSPPPTICVVNDFAVATFPSISPLPPPLRHTSSSSSISAPIQPPVRQASYSSIHGTDAAYSGVPSIPPLPPSVRHTSSSSSIHVVDNDANPRIPSVLSQPPSQHSSSPCSTYMLDNANSALPMSPLPPPSRPTSTSMVHEVDNSVIPLAPLPPPPLPPTQKLPLNAPQPQDTGPDDKASDSIRGRTMDYAVVQRTIQYDAPTTLPRIPLSKLTNEFDEFFKEYSGASRKAKVLGAAKKDCPICKRRLIIPGASIPVQVKPCKHVFHASCITHVLQHGGPTCSCPTCKQQLVRQVVDKTHNSASDEEGDSDDDLDDAILQGQSPSGTMTIKGVQDGFRFVKYDLPAGRQMPYHDNPGVSYPHTSRPSYIPDTAEGRLLLRRLEHAFVTGHLFRVGTNLKGQTNVITWTNVPHKTTKKQGPFGYPDPNYISNCHKALDALSIPSAKELLLEDLDQDSLSTL